MSSTETVETVVVGAGHAGLAVSRLLTEAGRDHVVLERGHVAERWRTERWDSLHLLTPSWMVRLPGWEYDGPAPDSFLSASRFVSQLEAYARSFCAPVMSGTTVLRVAEAAGPESARYVVESDRGTWRATNIVIATGPYGRQHVPAGLGELFVVPSSAYRNPAALPPGRVLVVGASSSGVQIADELNRSGREVSIAVGRHTRMPRRYRGLDIYHWLQSTGRLAQTIDQVPDRWAARHEPSLQLVGRSELDRSTRDLDLDLGTLQRQGVRLLGRFEGVDGSTIRFRPDLATNLAAADLTMHRFLDMVDDDVRRHELARHVCRGTRPQPVVPSATTDRMHLRAESVGAVVLATGQTPHNPWLRLPIAAADGVIQQHRGVTPAPGVYVVGQRFQHRRDSASIDGARHDAAAVVGHLVGTTPVVDVDVVEEWVS